MTFSEKIDAIVQKNNSLVCVGLDPDIDKLPDLYGNTDNALFEFNKAIIDKTYDLVCCYKPNSAFYEALGADGIQMLKETCDYIKEIDSDIPILLDYKRGDIGNTNQKYADFAFKYLNVDAITLHPYQGSTALKPYFDCADKGIFILAKTSNDGSEELQNLLIDGKPLYEIVSAKAVKEWNDNNNVFLVAGATYPKELGHIRKIAGDSIILVPGVGAQEGDMKDMLKAGLNSEGKGLIINSSRSILYASSGEDFAEASRQETENLKNQINQFRS
jgi:orotidine-5'-phosphate decarboxylase